MKKKIQSQTDAEVVAEIIWKAHDSATFLADEIQRAHARACKNQESPTRILLYDLIADAVKIRDRLALLEKCAPRR